MLWQNASEIKIAEENGAVFAGGADLVKKVLCFMFIGYKDYSDSSAIH